MRIRSVLFGLLVACGSGEQRAEQAPAPPPSRPPQQIAAPIIKTYAVTLPQVVVQAMPLDQVQAPWALTASDGSGLLATRVEAKAVVQGPLAFTELHLYFANTENRIREGTFAITLPTGAAVSRFAMETDGQLQEAEVVEKQLARRAYEDFLHRRQDPALMEKAAGNQFTARVFPIPAKGTKHLVISFSQELPGERYTLPLRGLPKVEQLDVELAVTNLDGSRVAQKLSKRDWQPDQDFVSTAPTTAEAITVGSLVITQVSPFDQSSVAKDVPEAMTLLVDTSASRALGFARYASNVRELVSSLAGRYPGLTIEVVAFDQDTQAVFSGPATQFGTAEVDALVKRGAAGASDLAQALDKMPARERVVILTDGVVTAGVAGKALATKVKELATKQVARVDVIMAGGIRDQALATTLVTAGLPRTGAVLDLDQQLSEVVAGLGERVLTDLTVEVAGATWVYPRTIRSARPNQRTMVYARFDKPQPTIDVTIGQHHRSIGTVGGTPALIERATAAAEVAELEAKLASAKPEDTKAVRAEIVKKAVAARVISDETSMLVLETDGDYARYGIDRNALADILVVGPLGVEQRNRTYHAAKRTKTPQIVQREDSQFALEGKAGKIEKQLQEVAGHAAPTRAMAMRISGEYEASGGVVAEYKRSGVEGGVAGGVVGGELNGVAAPPEPKPAKEASFDSMIPPPAPAATAPPPAPVVAESPSADPSSGRDSSRVEEPRAVPPQAETWPPPGSPAPLKGKLAEIDRAIRRGDADAALARAQAWHDKEPGDVLALIGLGEALEAKHDTAQAARIYGSIIDLFPGRADLRRFAGERLERIGETARALAVDTYRRAVEERPDHMTGHRLLAYALLRNNQHAEAFAAILKGLDQRYPDDRFAGGVRVITEDAGLIGAAYAAAQPDKKAEIVAALKKHHTSLPTRASTRFIMYWETDANDVDFHIQDAQGGHAFYSSPQLASGGELYADITTGYGPECFTIQGRPKAGPYKLSINYYSQGPMGYGMGLLQIVKFDGKGKLEFQDRPYVIMNDQAYVNLGTFRS
jgi:tetratricopeptide (TPR) repeat protein